MGITAVKAAIPNRGAKSRQPITAANFTDASRADFFTPIRAPALHILHNLTAIPPPNTPSDFIKWGHQTRRSLPMSKPNRTKLLLDILIFAAFLISMDPHTSGIAIHEWLSIALAGTVIVHLLLNWDWIAQFTQRAFTAQKLNGSRTNYILNWLLFIDGILIMLSGMMISEAVVPSLGFTLPLNFTWRSLHDLSANISLALMGLHLALHWSWIMSTLKRLFTGGASSSAVRVAGKDAQA
jgi:hypothetical protein